MSKEKIKRRQFHLPLDEGDLLLLLRMAAKRSTIEKRVTITELIRQAVKEFLERQKP